MTLVVHAWGAYPSFHPQLVQWRELDHDMNKMVKALKRRPVKGYATLKDITGKWRRIEQGTEQVADEIFGLWGAAKLEQLGIDEAVLVPVPSSSMTDPQAECTAARMAAAIQTLSSNYRPIVTVERCLCFEVAMPSASAAGGTREQAVIRANLRCSATGVRGRRLILVDDVLTSGGHLRACAEALRSSGAIVEQALVAARTVQTPATNPLNMPPEDIDCLDF